MKEKTIKRKELNKGITLIALVITIIVLLILAGVTIATLTGDNGLLSKANSAKNASTEAEIEEKLKLAYQDYYLGQHTETGYTFQKALDKMFGTGVAKASGPDSNEVYTVSLNGKTYEFNSVTGVAGEKKPTLADVTLDNYGDYIDLGQIVEGVGTSVRTDDWRILYNDKNGRVYAILADFLPNNNPAVTAAGLNKVGETTYNVNIPSSSNRDVLLSKLDDAEAWQSLIPQGLRSSCPVKGAVTASILLASYNEKYDANVEPADWPYFRTDPEDESSSIDNLYIKYLDGYSECYGYFVNLRTSDNPNGIRTGASQGKLGSTNFYNEYIGIRPVVSLPSNLQVTNNNGVWTVVLPVQQ